MVHEAASGHADGHQHGGHAHGKPPDSECRSFCAAKLDGGANGEATCKWKACAGCPECDASTSAASSGGSATASPPPSSPASKGATSFASLFNG